MTTTQGAIAGSRYDSIVAFLGIPYAAPPVGERRFRAPVRPSSWEGIRPARHFGQACPQMPVPDVSDLLNVFRVDEQFDEDCLYLNVWAPSQIDEAKPVMVWIHGGGFSGGSGSQRLFDGAALAATGVVIVTINYRLHALGFLYLDELFDEASHTGNLGILDQIAALQWVRENIAAFGGDPENVTIFGESAGAMSVATLMATPSADGLFHRAIAQSGAGHHNLSAQRARRVAQRALTLLDVKPGDWSRLLAVPSSRLVEVGLAVSVYEAPALLGTDRNLLMGLQPVVDGVTRSERPIDAIRRGASSNVDLIIGTCADEWRFFIWGTPPEMREQLAEMDPTSYFGDQRATEAAIAVYAKELHWPDRLDHLAAIETDQMFTIPAIRMAEAREQATGSTRMYRMIWPSPANDGELGACHLVDVPFIFGTTQHARPLVGDHPSAELGQALRGAWTNFAFTGDPNGGRLPTWPEYEPSSRLTMQFGEVIEVQSDPLGPVRDVWAGRL